MKSGYKIFWTQHALSELAGTIEYLESYFSDKEIEKLATAIEHTVNLIAQNPNLFSISETGGVHKVTILRFNTMYYRLKDGSVEILSFFSNRQNPEKRKF